MIGLGAPQPLELALLQHAQQLHLRRQVDVADLVEKQRAALGELEPAFLALLGAGEGALLVAEELRFDQAVGQRRAAHLDERLVRARRVVVDGVRDQLLAGARLAANEHRGVGRGHLRHLLVHLAHRPARADDAREVVALRSSCRSWVFSATSRFLSSSTRRWILTAWAISTRRRRRTGRCGRSRGPD